MKENKIMDSIEHRIQELLVELQECRDDQRNNESIIIQTVAAVASVLSIVSGVSYLSKGDILQIQLFSPNYAETAEGVKKIIYHAFELFTPARIFFYISCLAFCTIFGYISVRGVKATMLYYYIQNIEDRLNTLIECKVDDADRGQLLHFDDFFSPISTLNYKHLSSSYSMWHYITVLSVVICAIGCSLGFVFLQYLSIRDLLWQDTFALFITVVTMLFTLFMYLRTTKNAHNIFQFSIDTAHENINARMEKGSAKLYSESTQFLRRFKYFLLPRKNEWYKNLKTVAGYTVAHYLCKTEFRISKLFLLLFLFDFLLYGARYQINDIRGISEDIKVKLHRLASESDIEHKSVPVQAIENSLVIVFIKVLVALIFTVIFAWDERKVLFGCYFALLLCTVLYEFFKRLNISGSLPDWIVFLAVGTGYPLRFVIGYLFAKKTFQLNTTSIHFLFFLFAMFFGGIFATLLSWTQRVLKVADRYKANNSEWTHETWCAAKECFRESARFKRLIRVLEKDNYCHRRDVLRYYAQSRFFHLSPWDIFYCLAILANALAVLFVYRFNNESSWVLPLVYLITFLFIYVPGDAILVFMIPIASLLVFFAFSFSLIIRVYLLEYIIIIITYWYLRFEPMLGMKEITLRDIMSGIKKGQSLFLWDAGKGIEQMN